MNNGSVATEDAEVRTVEKEDGNPVPKRKGRASRNVSFNLEKNTTKSTFEIRRVSDVWFQDRDIRKHFKGYHKDVKRLHKGKNETRDYCYRGLETEVEFFSKQIGISDIKQQVFQHQGSHTPEEIAALYGRHCRSFLQHAREMGESDAQAARDAQAELPSVSSEPLTRRITLTTLPPKFQFWKQISSSKISLES